MNKSIKLLIAGAALAAGAVALYHADRQRVSARTLHQLRKRFAKQTIYGTWLVRKSGTNVLAGGINILSGETIIQYQFHTDHRGRILNLVQTNTSPVKRF